MARALIGISNTSIDKTGKLIRTYFKHAEHDPPKIKVLGFEDRPDAEDLKNVVLLVPSVQVMQDRADVLTKAACVVIVFGPPVVLDYLKDVPKPDVQVKPNSFTYRFQDLSSEAIGTLVEEGLQQKNEVVIQMPEVSVIPTMLHRTPGSIAGAIMNYLYSMPDHNARMKIQHLIYTWIGTEATLEDLEAKIYLVTKTPKKRPAALGRLFDFLSSEDGEKARSAMRHIRECKEADKPVASKAVAKKFGLSEYDVSYALKASNTALRSGTIVDAKPLNEFFWERKASDKAKVRTKDKKAKASE